jgi:hypothetical protein
MDERQETLWGWLCRTAGPEVAGQARGALDLSAAKAYADKSAAKRLHVELEQAVGDVVDLAITNNRRRMVTAKKRRGRHEFRVHHMFVDADSGVVAALARMIRGDASARDEVREFVKANRDAIEFEASPEQLTPTGKHFDLVEVMARAMAFLPEDRELPSPAITWGRRGRGSRSIRFGSYDFDQGLIRIHPALDQAWVPDFFVEFVVFHELLHAVFPPEVVGGRREIHTTAFREWEATYPRFDEAMEWEAENIGRFLR